MFVTTDATYDLGSRQAEEPSDCWHVVASDVVAPLLERPTLRWIVHRHPLGGLTVETEVGIVTKEQPGLMVGCHGRAALQEV